MSRATILAGAFIVGCGIAGFLLWQYERLGRLDVSPTFSHSVGHTTIHHHFRPAQVGSILCECGQLDYASIHYDLAKQARLQKEARRDRSGGHGGRW